MTRPLKLLQKIEKEKRKKTFNTITQALDIISVRKYFSHVCFDFECVRCHHLYLRKVISNQEFLHTRENLS